MQVDCVDQLLLIVSIDNRARIDCVDQLTVDRID